MITRMFYINVMENVFLGVYNCYEVHCNIEWLSLDDCLCLKLHITHCVGFMQNVDHATTFSKLKYITIEINSFEYLK